jgi:RNA polymerase sigma-70 factor (ECF subfamily)
MPTDRTGAILPQVSVPSSPGPSAAPQGELELLRALRRREESAFGRLIRDYHRPLLRVARAHVPSLAVAEEVVQETWLGVCKGLENFAGRCSLKAWIFQILLNRAKTRGQRERRLIPFSSVFDLDSGPGDPALGSRQLNPNHPKWVGGWVALSHNRSVTPEQSLLSQELKAHTEAAIEALPPSQRQVLTLRGVQGWTAEEVCSILGITDTNQRVLLHRARSKVRRALHGYSRGRAGSRRDLRRRPPRPWGPK